MEIPNYIIEELEYFTSFSTMSPHFLLTILRKIFNHFISQTEHANHKRNRVALRTIICNSNLMDIVNKKITAEKKQYKVETIINAMVLDNYFRWTQLGGLQNVRFASAFSCLVDLNKVNTQQLFIWNSKMLIWSWTNALNRSISNNISLCSQLISFTVRMTLYDYEKREIYFTQKPKLLLPDRKPKDSFAIQITQNIYKDMFQLPSDWKKDQVVCFVASQRNAISDDMEIEVTKKRKLTTPVKSTKEKNVKRRKRLSVGSSNNPVNKPIVV